MTFWDCCGLGKRPISSWINAFVCLVHLSGVVYVIAHEDINGVQNGAWFFAVFTILHGVFVFSATFVFLKRFMSYGSAVFGDFSFWRTLLHVFMVLSNSIFFLQIASDDTAFYVTKDVQETATRMDRLRLLSATMYSAGGILTSVGYGDITPARWYSRLVILPNFMFTFFVAAAFFGTFMKSCYKDIDISIGTELTNRPVTPNRGLRGYASTSGFVSSFPTRV